MPILLQINTTLNYGSTGRIAEQISLLAEKKGWDCYIAHGARYVNRSQFKSIQIGSKLENLIHAFLGEYLGDHGFGSTLGTYLFLKKVKRLKPDIIHLHNIHGYYINITLLFKFIAKYDIPVVWTLHDCWSFTGHCTHFENAGCYKWKTECYNCPLLMAQYKSRIFDRSYRNFLKKKQLYDHVRNMTLVPVSQWLGQLVSQSILGNHKIRVITNGIDLQLFKPLSKTVSLREKYQISKEKIIVLGVVSSGFDKEKGRLDFVKLSLDGRYAVVIVGLSDSDKAGLPDSIIKIGKTENQRELAWFYSEADVFVNATYNESLGLTNIEAMACGTPVVSYAAGGSIETIDENTGILVEKGNVEGLKEAINEVNRVGKQYYYNACLQRVRKLFNKEEKYKLYLNLYEEIVENAVADNESVSVNRRCLSADML